MRTLGRIVVLASCILCSPGPAEAGDSGWTFFLQGSSLWTDPDANVREFAVEGSTLDLDESPGLTNPGFGAQLGVEKSLGPWRLDFEGSYSRNHGRGSSSPAFNFNGGTYPAGRDVASTLETYRGLLRAATPALHLPGACSARFLFGIEYYHPLLTMQASPPVATHDVREDFLQFLPIPLLGLELSSAPIGKWDIDLNAWAGTAQNWNTGREEGGPMRMDLTLVEGSFFLRRSLSGSIGLGLGYTFKYANGTLTSSEDGNWIQSREHGLALRLAWNL